MVHLLSWLPGLARWTPEHWSALGTCATAVIAVLAAGVAWRQVREARRLREEQAQPYVAVFMESSTVSQQFTDLVVKNFGSTAAYEVKVSFEPSLQRSRENGNGVEDVHVPTVLRTLVPLQEWRCFWDHGPSRVKTDLPDLYEAEVSYYSSYGKNRRRYHVFRYQLDYGARHNTMYVVQYGIHDAAKSMREIRDHIKGWTEWPKKGLSVFMRDGDAKDERRRQEFAQAKAQHEEIHQQLLPARDEDSEVESMDSPPEE